MFLLFSEKTTAVVEEEKHRQINCLSILVQQSSLQSAVLSGTRL